MRKKSLWIVIGILAFSIGITAFFIVETKAFADDLEKARTAYEKENYETSIQLLESVVEKEPKNTEARLLLADSYLKTQKFDRAETLLEDGIKLTPEEPKFYTYLADLYLHNKQVTDALEILDKGKTFNNHKSIQKAYNRLISQITIHTPRTLVQKGFTRTVELQWKGEEDAVISLDAEWSSHNTEVGKVKASSNQVAVFKAIEPGTATIQADWQSLTWDFEMKVDEQVLKEMTLEQEEIDTLPVGEILELSVTGVDEAGEPFDFSPVWSSEKERIEFDEDKGKSVTIEGIKEGKETIKVKYKDQELSIPINIVVEASTFSIDSSHEGEGAVWINPNEEEYSEGDTVTIEAKSSEGWEFIHWEGDLSGAPNPATVTIEEDLAFKAIFEQKSYKLRLSTRGNGRIIRDSLASTYPYNEKVSLRARPDDGWKFAGWKGSVTSRSSEVTVIMDEDQTLQAVFEKVERDSNEGDEENEEPVPPEPESYSLNVNVSGEGSVQKSKSGSRFSEGSKVQLTASPKEGWVFTGWSGSSSSSSSSITLTMNANKNVTANFKKEPEPEKRYSLSTSVIGQGYINTSATTVVEGEAIVVTALPADGWEFVEWRGALSGSSALSSVNMNENKSIVAVFEQIPE
ncbi:tetratricopeptide repeat protein [Halobacillus yeomjeoni]|uniref:InlB B-repeat-containing protein n=1 Tax=Halobacillus yeomjeoni TaxID=311194 RepID=UPI001CD45FC4|nr:tetratricopeptide repeat protein [Halobacillus yeomjeoni]MCA0985193.1 tetratricopeptide repeat protein [Halobacillus yeomjeoni]